MLNTFIKYKIEAIGGYFIKVDKFYPSSKLCNCCSYKYTNLKLNERTWVCPNCNTLNDRDSNSSINLFNEGKTILNNMGIVIV